MPELPRVFIGSSVEGLPVAEAIALGLDHVARPQVWTDGVFGLSSEILDSLLDVSRRTDYAVLVLTPDDVLTKRDLSKACPRDNLVFELGLFMGRIGRARCFIVHERSKDLELPSDLAGVKTATYVPASGSELLASVRSVCTQIKVAIHETQQSVPGFPPEKVARLLGEWDFHVKRVDPLRSEPPDKVLKIRFQVENGVMIGRFLDKHPINTHECIVSCELLFHKFLVLRSRPADSGIDQLGLFVLQADHLFSEFNGKMVGISAKYGDVISENITLSGRVPDNPSGT
ncbi:MAG: nucleotide-binding protein [Planctomycetes bacterium]|nr:nucleotide-binding protein [Planctomycetota bacterium]